MNRKIIPWEEIGLDNDFVFCKIMQDEAICKQLLETLLHIKITKLVYVEDQKNINITRQAKSVRLDVYVEDGDRIFDIEMQATSQGDLPKRSRYYQGMIDMNHIEKGATYYQLKESYIIFICTFDPFGQGLPRYSFDYTCKENHDIALQDEAHKIFFNASAYSKEEDANSRAFLQYLYGGAVSTDFVAQIDDKMNKIKSNTEWGLEYMTLAMRDRENFDEGNRIGFEKGREEGIEKSINILKEFGVSDEVIVMQLVKQYGLTHLVAKKYLQS